MSENDSPLDGQGELFGSVAASAFWPNPGTVARALLDRLLRGERISQPAFLDVSWRLAAAVHDLQKSGWPVQSTPVACPGVKRPIASYHLSNTAIAAARAAQGGAQ